MYSVSVPTNEPALHTCPGRRLSRALFPPNRRHFGGIAAVAGNVLAIDAAMLFGAGLAPFVALIGPTGWGKSQLLAAAASAMQEESHARPELVSALEWLSDSRRADRARVLLIDDAQDALSRPRLRQQFRQALSRRVRPGRPTMIAFSTTAGIRSIEPYLPKLHVWTVALINEPTVREREVILDRIARSEGLDVPADVIAVLARRLQGNGIAIRGAMERLKMLQPNWVDPLAVLGAFGMLQPHLGDATGWDLRDQLHDSMLRWFRARRSSSGLSATEPELGVFLLRAIARLSEQEVAGYYGLPPGDVFRTVVSVSANVPEEDRSDLVAAACDELLGQARR